MREVFAELVRDRLLASVGVDSAGLAAVLAINLIWASLSRIGQLRPVLPMTSNCLRRAPWSQDSWMVAILASLLNLTTWIYVR